MKRASIIFLIGVVGSLALLNSIDLAHGLDRNPSSQTIPPAASGLGLYKPPLLGAPRLRVGGGVRGAGNSDTPVLQVLAPLQTGRTTLAQPILYWHLDQPTNHAVEITVMEAEGVSPLIREILASPVTGGLHAFRLANQHLEIGKEYEWFVAVILDPAQRSKDILAGGGLLRVAASPSLQGELGHAKPGEAGLIYARSGLWYDAIKAMLEGASRTEGKTVLTKEFSTILQQEEIAGVALSPPINE